MSKITTRKSAKRLTPAAAKRAARAALDIVLLNIAVSVGSKASGDKLLRSICQQHTICPVIRDRLNAGSIGGLDEPGQV